MRVTNTLTVQTCGDPRKRRRKRRKEEPEFDSSGDEIPYVKRSRRRSAARGKNGTYDASVAKSLYVSIDL